MGDNSMLKISGIINRQVYQRDPELIHHPVKKSMDAFIIQAIFGTMFGIFTGGVFLSGYLINLGAEDDLVSYLPLIPSICGMFLIFCGPFVEKFNRRRTFVLIINGLTKVTLASVIFIPLFVPKIMQIPIIYFMLIVGYILNGINGLAINSWFISVIPTKIRGRYFSIRQTIAVILSIVFPVMAGRLVDIIPNKYNGFMILYVIAMAAAFFENVYFGRIDDPEIKTIDKKMNIIEIIKIPLKNKKFRSFTLRQGFFYMFLYIAASFSQLYMLKYFKLTYTFISSASIVSAVLQAFIFYRVWGKINDRFGSNFVMITSMWFYAVDMFIWFLMTPGNVKVLLPLGYALGAVESSGFTLGTFNRRYEIIPEEGRPIYDSFYSAYIGIILLVSPVIGGKLRDYAANIDFFKNFQYGNFRVVYFLSSLALILLQIYNVHYIRRTEPDSECLKSSAYKESLKTMRLSLWHR
jgi:MFS family permease